MRALQKASALGQADGLGISFNPDTGVYSLILSSTGGVEVGGSGVDLKLADASLQTSSSGVSVHPGSARGLSTDGSGLGIKLATNPGLAVSASGLTLLEADSSLSLAAGGAAVALNATGGLQTSSGVGLKLADASLQTAAGGVSVHLADLSLQTVAGGLSVLPGPARGLSTDGSGLGIKLATNSGLGLSTSGVTIALADTSLSLAAGGIAAQLLSTGGLQTGVGGMSIKLNSTTLTTSASGIGVNIAAPGGLGVSSGLFVNGFRTSAGTPGSPAIANAWFDTTAVAFKANWAPSPGFIGVVVCNMAQWAASQSVTANTAAQTFATDTVAFNAAFLNIVGRQFHIRLHLTFSAAALANAFTFNVQLGSTVIATFTTATLASGSQDNVVDVLVSTRTTGSSGTVTASMAVVGTTSAVSLTTTTVNLTLAQTLQFSASATTTNATDSITIQEGTVCIEG